MTTNNFRTIALALRDHISDTYQLLNAADAVESIIPKLQGVAPEALVGSAAHERNVNVALRSPDAMGFMRNQRKILAIKQVRILTGCGLKEAKAAVEDERVIVATGYVVQSYERPSWSDYHDDDEPSF